MRPFLWKAMSFCLVVIAADMVFAGVLRRFRPVDYRQFLESRQTYFSTEKNYDILIFGDSHIADALDCRTIERGTGLSAYNLGVYHAGPYEVFHVIRAALGHQDTAPKIVVLGTNPNMFYRRMVAGKYTPLIVPGLLGRTSLYWHSEEPIGAEFFFRSVKEKYLVQSLKRVITKVPYKPTREVKEVYNGYLASVNQIPGTKWDNFAVPGVRPIHKGQVQYFRQCIREAKSCGARVVVVNSPIWWRRLDTEIRGESFAGFRRTLDSVANAEGVEVFNADYQLLRAALNKEDFLNNEHLNTFGAQKFSEAFGQHIFEKLASSNSLSRNE